MSAPTFTINIVVLEGLGGERYELILAKDATFDDIAGPAAAWIVRTQLHLERSETLGHSFARLLAPTAEFGLNARKLIERIASDLEQPNVSDFMLRRVREERPALSFEPFVTDMADLADLANDDIGPSRPATTWFELRLVDELGEPIEGTGVDLRIDGENRRLATDAEGKVRVDDATTSFASARVEIADIRTTVGPRWDRIREGEYLEESTELRPILLRELDRSISLTSKEPQTLSIQPRVVLARLKGMLFDTNKTFLLPSAIISLKKVKALYDENPNSTLLIVGHTDTTGTPSINDPLALERAEMAAAYLADDVDTWLAQYATSISSNRRWQGREDRLMMASMQDFGTKPSSRDPVRWYQETRGLTVDGIAGPQTRETLVAEYMQHDDTTLPETIEIISHGCGENFPLTPSGEEIDEFGPDGHSDQLDRRIELFFFDDALGVQPPVPARTSAPDGVEYPEWRRRARETHEFDHPAEFHTILVRLHDREREPIARARGRIMGSGLELIADDDGFVGIDFSPSEDSLEIEWGPHDFPDDATLPHSRRIFVQYDLEETGERRKLHNLGYDHANLLEDNVRAFQRHFGRDPSGVLADIRDALHGWHDGGHPPTSKSGDAAGEASTKDSASPPATSPGSAPPSKGSAVPPKAMLILQTVDSVFAPGAESLDIQYDIDQLDSETITLEISSATYPNNPVFTREFTAAEKTTGTNKTIIWDGRSNHGPLATTFISPAFSPYEVAIRVTAQPGLDQKKDTEVQIDSIELIVNAPAATTIIMNDPTRDVLTSSKVLVKDKAGGTTVTPIEFDVVYTRSENPGNTTAAGSHAFGGTTKLGKRGNAAAIYWKIHPSNTASSSDAFKTRCTTKTTTTTGTDQGVAKILLKPSAVGGNRYRVKAEIFAADGTTSLASEQSPELTITRNVVFTAFEMSGQAHLSTHGTKALQDVFYTADTFVDYQLGALTTLSASSSVKYIGLWDHGSTAQLNWGTHAAKTVAETPTAAETTVANTPGVTPAQIIAMALARAQIQTKADAWRDRLLLAYTAGLNNWAPDAGVPTNTLVAVEFEHPKFSFNAPNTDSVTSEWSSFPWLRITVEGNSIHPDQRWINGQGFSRAGRAYIMAGTGTARMRVVIAHEVGHETNTQFPREQFGRGDHSPVAGLMDPGGTRNAFTTREKQILRGLL